MKQLISWNIYKSAHYEESPEDIDPLIGRLIDDWMIGLVDTEGSPGDEMSNMQIDRLVDWLIDWLVIDQVDTEGSPEEAEVSNMQIDWLMEWLIDWLNERLIDWLICDWPGWHWLIDWLIEGLIYWLISDWQGWHWGEPGSVQYADLSIDWLNDWLTRLTLRGARKRQRCPICRLIDWWNDWMIDWIKIDLLID